MNYSSTHEWGPCFSIIIPLGHRGYWWRSISIKSTFCLSKSSSPSSQTGSLSINQFWNSSVHAQGPTLPGEGVKWGPEDSSCMPGIHLPCGLPRPRGRNWKAPKSLALGQVVFPVFNLDAAECALCEWVEISEREIAFCQIRLKCSDPPI